MKYYITTAIDYPSGNPHLGHAYEKICADVFARWHRLLGEDVFFLTGTDEHGLKIQRKAKQEKLTPKQYTDKISKTFKELCASLDISYNFFIRTTMPKHKKVAREIFKKLNENGDIYKGKYTGLYCVECEAYYMEKDLKNEKCPIHEKQVEAMEEESYFFKMSKYEKQVISHIKNNPSFIEPETKRIEILNRLKGGLKDLSVTRTSFKWGIPIGIDKKHVMYVWIDALTNYISGIDYPKEKFKKYWPADMHLIGTDIVWFHTVIWPSILLSAGIELPKKIFVHGFINTETGEKMSKSKGNIISPIEIAKKYGSDSLRYYLIREIPFGQDGKFSEKLLIQRHDKELANDLGNLVRRVTVMSEKYFDCKIEKAETDKDLFSELNIDKIKKYMANLEPNNALTEIWRFINHCNSYINEKQPWELAKINKNKLKKVLYNLTDALRIISILINPFMPKSSEKINHQLNINLGKIKDCKPCLLKQGKINKGDILFKKYGKS